MQLDEGYSFGIGAFETIAIENKRAIFLDEHLERLNKALKFFGIYKIVEKNEINATVEKEGLHRAALKIMVSEQNTIITFRENPYNQNIYNRGFKLCYSEVLRNPTSSFTFYKTLNYGDSILEKRKCNKKGCDEPIFFNYKNEICEGATSNIFFVNKGCIITPAVSCGLLAGIMREYLIKKYDIIEETIKLESISNFDECFVTNSLMGIMPVVSFGDILFKQRCTADRLQQEYISLF